jgi:hypothetical protein
MKSMFKGALSALIVVLALSGLTAASALAAGAPIVTTKAAVSIKGTAATLVGTVNPNGAETKDYFEYGPAISYGSKSREQTTTVEKTPQILVEGLSTRTTYHFRMVATNSYGTSYGADETFTTPAEKPEVVLASGLKYTQLEFDAKGTYTDLYGSGFVMDCNSSEFEGHFINSREFEGRMKWINCTGAKLVCTNKGAETEVESELLKGTLGYVNKAKQEVGLRLAGKSSEIWANNVRCPSGVGPLTGSLGGQLRLPVNTKIPTTSSFGIEYTEHEDAQITGELGGQLIYKAASFGINSTLNATASKEFEIQA